MRQRWWRSNDADGCEEANDVTEELPRSEEDLSVVVKRILGDDPKVLCATPRGHVEYFGIPFSDYTISGRSNLHVPYLRRNFV